MAENVREKANAYFRGTYIYISEIGPWEAVQADGSVWYQVWVASQTPFVVEIFRARYPEVLDGWNNVLIRRGNMVELLYDV